MVESIDSFGKEVAGEAEAATMFLTGPCITQAAWSARPG
jgi:hypothetical protein